MNQKKLVLVVALIFLLIGILMLKNPSPIPTTRILQLTTAVYSISGTITKVEKNAIIIKFNSLIYKVKIGKKTQMIQPTFIIPYVFKSQVTIGPKLEFNNLEVGNNVAIDTDKDLRILQKPEFEAKSITLTSPISRIITGVVKEVDDNKMIINGSISAFIPPGPTAKPADYAITFSSDTEITDTANKKVSAKNLVKNLNIVAYSMTNFSLHKNGSALKIIVNK